MVVAAFLASCLACFLLGLRSRPGPAAGSSGDLDEANTVLALLRQDIIELPSVVFAPTSKRFALAPQAVRAQAADLKT